MDKKTIAIVSTFPPSMQSLNEYGLHLAINFATNESVGRVIIIADQLDGPKEELEINPKIKVQRVWRFNSISTFAKITNAIKKSQPDLVIFNIQTASFGDREIPSALGLMTPFIARITRRKIGVIAHNMISGIDLDGTVLKGQKIRQAIVKFGAKVVDWAILHADYVTFTTTTYTNIYQKRFPKRDVNHVPHGTFDTEPTQFIPFEERGKIVVTMGKFGTYKRLETLLEAMQILHQSPSHHDLKLIIGGTDHPNAKGYLESLNEQNANNEFVTFHGYVAEEDIASFFSQARISVFDYSATTGSSGVLHQTASYGAIPVFPAIGDFIDVTDSEGIVGENYEPNDAQDMAKAIERVLFDPDRANSMALKNREAAEELPMSAIIEFHLSKA